MAEPGPSRGNSAQTPSPVRDDAARRVACWLTIALTISMGVVAVASGWWLAGAACAGVSVAVLYRQLVARPAQAVALTAGAVRDTLDLSLRAEQFSGMLGSLTDTFNDMLACLQKELADQSGQRQALEERQRHLQALVEQQQAGLQGAQQDLVDLSRQAGMSEIASGVLHNVGNVLNSVNVTASLMAERLRKSRVGELRQAGELVSGHSDDMARFVSEHPQGKHLAPYLIEMSKHLSSEQEDLIESVQSLQRNVEHIKQIVTMQQTYARISGVEEVTSVAQLIDDALEMRAASFTRHDIEVVRHYDELPDCSLDRHKVMQILVNLIGNAKHAISARGRGDGVLTITLRRAEGNKVSISVGDNGIGIRPEHMARIFTHGFTTKPDGHGFGLHSSALAAEDMGGALTVASEGVGCGACFTLVLPVTVAEVERV